MAAPQRTVQAPQPPKRTHYVSLHNHVIYPAMTSPSGWEDEHPEDWRPASPDEVAKYKAGNDTIKIEAVDLSADETDSRPEAALPHTIELAEEDPVANIPPAPAPVMSRSM
jgi:hypothetical protein